MTLFQVPIVTDSNAAAVELNNRHPFIMRSFDLGPCRDLWNAEYLSKKIGSTTVKVHVSEHSNMDFTTKNFVYKSITMKDLLKRFENNENESFFICSNEKYYLRSLGVDPRGRDVANLENHWPTIASDFKIPTIIPVDRLFSSVLRISSKAVRIWTHYDVMDNLLVQVRGEKDVVLWHPRELPNLYLDGDKSKVIDIENVDDKQFPNFKLANAYRCKMQQGDILYIPALWFHNTYSLTPGVAVNVFWKNLDPSLYDGKDSYGNKDLIPGANALLSIKTAKKNLEKLPMEYRHFYIRRIIDELQKDLT